jgi:[acyl-carrier-protein] S-malonyltransferase
VTTEIAFARLLNEFGITADICAGLSLGEYSALAYANAIDADAAIKLVRKRGQLMEAAVPAGIGAMSAILGLDEMKLQDACNEAMEAGIVEIANYNCPGQLVIGGEAAAVAKAGELALEKGAKRCIPLNVSGPFHTSLLKEAGTQLRAELEKINFNELSTPVVFNISGGFESGSLVDILEQQIQSSVYFEKSISKMLDEGVECFIEVGPSKTLSGFVKKINRKVKTYNIEDIASLNKILKDFGKEEIA